MSPRASLAVAAETPARWADARALAARLDLPVGDGAAPDLLLVLTDDRLELRQTGRPAPGPVYADFVRGRAGYRLRSGEGRRQPLARAAGLRKGRCPRVLDATAGLGGDAFVLASLGCDVTLVERSPVVAALLNDALARALACPSVRATAGRMTLVAGDARGWLTRPGACGRPDLVYLDPMYPERRHSALARKEMRLLRRLVGEDEDAGELLQAALARARSRVVVKRPSRAGHLGRRVPSFSIQAPKTRYDVYLTGSPGSGEGV